MQVKVLEIRDSGTFIPVLAIAAASDSEVERWFLRRCGYDPYRDSPTIIVAKLDANGDPCSDCYGWGSSGRTMGIAHEWIEDHWAELESGSVIDVEFILGETTSQKRSERYSHLGATQMEAP